MWERARENSVSYSVWESPSKIVIKFNHKTFNVNHVRLTSSLNTRSLASKGENAFNAKALKLNFEILYKER